MRIISGQFKNRELKSPNDPSTHPMGERQRLALFNILLPFLPNRSFSNLRVLDLFAGSGALGLEAISRGATKVVFVDKSKKSCKIIQENLQNLGLFPHELSADETSANFASKPQVKILSVPVGSLALQETFDLIFLDPPYSNYNIDFLKIKPLLAPDGVLAISAPKNQKISKNSPTTSKNLDSLLGSLKILKDKSYANCRLLVAK